MTLTSSQAAALQDAGSRLASDTTYRGNENTGESEDAEPDRTVIECQQQADDRWRVRVREAIGLVVVDDLQIEVQPKIPLRHLLYLFERTETIPRLDEQRGLAAQDESLLNLVVRWFLSELERILQRDLIRGYNERHEDLRVIRGRLRPIPTALAYYRAQMEFPCDYEDYSPDMPLNRLLRESAHRVGRCSALEWPERRRAIVAISRMGQVGKLRPGDRNAPIDRSSSHYRDAAILARNILDGLDRFPQSGEHVAWTFLFKTPDIVERGIRKILDEDLGPRWSVTNKGKQVDGEPTTFYPDLVFNGGVATGDVKYTIVSPKWRRQDIYQAIAFATIYKTQHAALIGFRRPGDKIAGRYSCW